jgi:hypothetical protein
MEVQEEPWREGDGKNRWRYRQGTNETQIEIELTQGQVAIIDAERWDEVKGYRWCASKHKTGIYYAAHGVYNPVTQKSKMLHMHVYLYPNIVPPRDHIDHNGCNNLAANIRSGAGGINQRNRNRPRKCSIDADGSVLATWFDENGASRRKHFHPNKWGGLENANKMAEAHIAMKNEEVIRIIAASGRLRAPSRVPSNAKPGAANLSTGIRGLSRRLKYPKTISGHCQVNGIIHTKQFPFAEYGTMEGAIAAGEAWLEELRNTRLPRVYKKRKATTEDIE